MGSSLRQIWICSGVSVRRSSPNFTIEPLRPMNEASVVASSSVTGGSGWLVSVRKNSRSLWVIHTRLCR